MPTPDPTPLPRQLGEPAAPVPAEPAPTPSAVPEQTVWWHAPLGFAVFVGCLEAGEAVKTWLGLILPGNMLGLFLLLALLGTGAVPLRWVAGAARWLLWLLPLLFMPIFVYALHNRDFWVADRGAFAAVVALATVLLWAATGHLAQWTFRKTHALRSGRPGTHPVNLAEIVAGLPFIGWTVFWSGLTILVYFLCRRLFLRWRFPLLHPGFTGILTVTTILELTGRHYEQYYAATGWINWLLGPAVVAMAVPIFQLRRTVRASVGTLAAVLPFGLGVAVSSMVLGVAALHRAWPVVAGGALKSITSPVAYRLAVDAGVSVDAAMAGVLIAGMLGATVGPTVLHWLRIHDERAVGLALGCTSHGIGVARATEIGPTAGAYASLGMSGTAMLGAVVMPFALRWLAGHGG